MRISPTQVGKGRRCERIIGFEYVEGIKAPSSIKQEFGTRVHAFLEEWLSAGVLPDNSPEGQVAKQGIQGKWLPPPDKGLMVEHKFQFLLEEDINLMGFVDCGVPPELTGDGVPVVIDHKTTSDLRWAKTESQLSGDEQALIYAMWAMLHWNTPTVKCRWIYYAASNPKSGPRKPRGAKPVELLFDARKEIFHSRVELLAKDIRRVVEIRKRGIPGLELQANPGGCGMFGGCFYRDRCQLEGGSRLAAYFEKDTIK